MNIDILTAFPEILSGMVNRSINRGALQSKLVDIWVHDLRHFSTDRHGKIDDSPFGGGPGMVMKAQPIWACLDHLRRVRQMTPYLIYMSPQGELFSQDVARRIAELEWIVILSGHYKGVDARVFERDDWKEISIGDFVLSGGEIPAALVADSIVRLIPGVLGDEDSARTDSFEDGLLDGPYYTRPAELQGYCVPEILQSGDHARIAAWRTERRKATTLLKRPDLLLIAASEHQNES